MANELMLLRLSYLNSFNFKIGDKISIFLASFFFIMIYNSSLLSFNSLSLDNSIIGVIRNISSVPSSQVSSEPKAEVSYKMVLVS